MNWQVAGTDGFVYAQFAYGVDALEFKQNSPEYIREHLKIVKIGEQE